MLDYIKAFDKRNPEFKYAACIVIGCILMWLVVIIFKLG